jgi:hypothetical protein
MGRHDRFMPCRVLLVDDNLWVPRTRVGGEGEKRRCSCLSLAVWPDRVSVVAGRSERVVVSLFYWSLRRLLGLVVLRCRSEREKEIEILLLRHQLRVLERQVARP